jgi:hypothetical protein
MNPRAVVVSQRLLTADLLINRGCGVIIFIWGSVKFEFDNFYCRVQEIFFETVFDKVVKRGLKHNTFSDCRRVAIISWSRLVYS